MVKIELDLAKCSSSRECRKCLESCPQRILLISPKAARKPGRPATGWEIVAVLPVLCTGCRACEQVCPQKAIRVTPGLATAVAEGRRGIKRASRRLAAGLCVWLGEKAYVP